jgi:hypothetical protein
MALPLRERLESLARERSEHEEQLQGIRRATGEALLEVRDDDELSLTEAATILDLSRPTVYCLLEDAGAPA